MAEASWQKPKRKILLLTGAPARRGLSWNDSDLTVTQQQAFEETADCAQRSSGDDITWRNLTSRREDAIAAHQVFSCWDSGDNSHHDVQDEYVVDFSTISDGMIDSTEIPQARNVVEEESLSTRISHTPGHVPAPADESFWNISTGPSQITRPFRDHLDIANLSDLPPAEHIQGIAPTRSIKYNLVVIVLAISIQQMQLGKGTTKTPVDLVRLTVADETSSAFEISIWLDTVDGVNNGGRAGEYGITLRYVVAGLQRLDVLLIQNVILRVFQSKVNANSLRRTTEIHLLYRENLAMSSGLLPHYSAGSIRRGRFKSNEVDPILEKVIRLLDWRDNFLQAPMGDSIELVDSWNEDSQNGQTGMGIRLPDDTQLHV